MKKFIFLISLITLIGCSQSEVIVSTKYTVVMPDSKMFECPSPRLPVSSTLTDSEVANLITQLFRNNVVCRNNIKAIEEFLQKAKVDIETKK